MVLQTILDANALEYHVYDPRMYIMIAYLY
jgi:hypothetical protein